MKRPLLSVAALCLAVSGGALANHQAPNLKAFKTVCVTGSFEEQGQQDDGVLGKLLGRLEDALDRAGIQATENCEVENGVSGRTQLNLYFEFTTTKSGTAFVCALDGWLNTSDTYTDVTLWHDSFFGSIEAGSGADQAADNLDELLDGFIEEWDSVH
ncbi:hypothetical protein [Deinococcus frigens]|uniref:hypothetical protein n=1 Tax=Deinococcus frigens TaxID=249403 RepID=UPI000495215B|nr:hypothetical protein [Deinococcus frigens]